MLAIKTLRSLCAEYNIKVRGPLNRKQSYLNAIQDHDWTFDERRLLSSLGIDFRASRPEHPQLVTLEDQTVFPYVDAYEDWDSAEQDWNDRYRDVINAGFPEGWRRPIQNPWFLIEHTFGFIWQEFDLDDLNNAYRKVLREGVATFDEALYLKWLYRSAVFGFEVLPAQDFLELQKTNFMSFRYLGNLTPRTNEPLIFRPKGLVASSSCTEEIKPF